MPKIFRIPPPKPRSHTKRLEEWHKKLLPGESIRTDVSTANCIRRYFNSIGVKVRRQTVVEKGVKKIHVWVIGPERP